MPGTETCICALSAAAVMRIPGSGELHTNMDAAYAEAYRLGGVASGEHGIGLSKRRYFLRETAAENLAAMNAIKDALDPLHILNDQKSYIKGDTDHAEPF